MPQMEVSDRKQLAVLWEAPTPQAGDSPTDDYGGATVAATPVEILVRWEAGKGEAAKQKVKAFVGREIQVGSTMWLGRIIDLPSSPTLPTNLMQVTSFDETPDVKGRIKQRTVNLVLLGSHLPQPTE